MGLGPMGLDLIIFLTKMGMGDVGIPADVSLPSPESYICVQLISEEISYPPNPQCPPLSPCSAPPTNIPIFLIVDLLWAFL